MKTRYNRSQVNRKEDIKKKKASTGTADVIIYLITGTKKRVSRNEVFVLSTSVNVLIV
jgi:hypothetical protein